MKIEKDINLKPYSTYRTGGKADFLCVCEKRSELVESIRYAKEQGIDYVVIGGGSNVLFSDSGFRGLVVVNRSSSIKIKENLIEVDSGFSLSKLIIKSTESGLSGFENLTGIPGTIGGAIYGNAGAFGSEISDNLIKVTVFRGGEEVILKKDEITFGYRNSLFKENDDLILTATFKLIKSKPERIKKDQKAIIEKRNNPKGLTCGSFFKNPKGDSAGRIIDSLGLKGESVGGAVVSESHANFIINTGNATSIDIYKLSRKLKKEVKKSHNTDLTEEVQLIGDF
jgi:UDP-N-acetylmuramate dehydrogenase